MGRKLKMNKIIRIVSCIVFIGCLSGCSSDNYMSGIDKDDVFNMMLDSDFKYDTISGRIINGKVNADNPFTVEFSVNMVEGESYSKMTDDGEISIETFVKDNERIDFDNTNKSEHVMSKRSTKRGSILNMSREDYENYKSIKADEENESIYDPTMPEMVRICTEPQKMAENFLENESLWEITGETKYLERNCYVIEGITEDKKDADKFKFMVDSQTGILLYYESYDVNDNLNSYMYAEEISFDYDSQKVNNLLEEKENLDYEKEYDYAPIISDFHYDEEWIKKMPCS